MFMNFESEKLDKIIPALIAAKAEIPCIEKATKGARSKYATIEDYLKAINGPLGNHGLFLSQPEQAMTDEQAMTMTDVCLVTTIYHTSGQYIRSVAPLIAARDLDGGQAGNKFQVYGGQLTYRRRYAIAAILGIAAEDEDDDAESLTGANITTKKRESTHTMPSTVITKEQAAILEDELKDLPDVRARFLKSRAITSINQLPSDRFAGDLKIVQERARQERELLAMKEEE